MTTDGVGVWAAFKNKLICVSRVSDLPTHFTGVERFEPSQIGNNTLNGSLIVGRGLIVANSKSRNKKFNMHLGAVLQRNDSQILITDMVEDGPVVNSEIKTMTLDATRVATQFRGTDYGDSGAFKLGLVVCEEDACFAALKERYKEGEIVDEPAQSE